MDYETLKKNTNVGWNTWNTANALSFTHLPEGFCINLVFRDNLRTEVLRESLIGRFGEREEKIKPGKRSFDGSYAELLLCYGAAEIRLRAAAVDDEQIILLEPVRQGLQPAAVAVEACLLWGKEGSLEKKDGRLLGHFGEKTFEIFSSLPVSRPTYTYSLSPSFELTLTGPAVISTVPCTAEDALRRLDAAEAELDRVNGSRGVHAEAYTAMKACLAWDTIYEEEHDRICSTVSRIWNRNWGGYVLFDWDTYFAALMASTESRELAFLNAAAITDEITGAGFVPNFGSAFGVKSEDRSQPPVGSAVCLKIFRKYPEKWFLEYVFDRLLRWNRWFFAHRTTPEGYMCWGSDPYEPANERYYRHLRADLQSAKYESGLDNSPMYDDAVYDAGSGLMRLADVGLMGLYVQDCGALAEIAEILGRSEALPELRERKNAVETALMTTWDEEYGMFLNKDLTTGALSRRTSPTNFYALASSRVTAEQKRRVLEEHFYNPEEYWGDWVLPMTPRNDPAYPDQDYWRGRIWAPVNYLVYEALKAAGLTRACRDLARRSEELICREWRLHGHVHENYSGDDGMGCGVGNSDKFYHWGGLLAYIALEEDEMA